MKQSLLSSFFPDLKASAGSGGSESGTHNAEEPAHDCGSVSWHTISGVVPGADFGKHGTPPAKCFEPSEVIESSAAASSSGGIAAVPRVPAGTVGFFEGGTIRWNDVKKEFIATCANRAHGDCFMTRGVSAKSHSFGTPMGLLIAWLKKHYLCSKEHHWSQEHWPDYGERSAARKDLIALADSGQHWARDLLEKELGGGKSPEPLEMPWRPPRLGTASSSK